MWLPSSVNSRIPPVATGRKKPDSQDDEYIAASTWLDRNQPVEQMTWMPGEPQLIHDRLIDESEWVDRPGMTIYNVYHPPTIVPGDPEKATRWLDHVYRIYSDDAEHILTYFAQRVQNPGVKINHALLLGGEQGIGKDTGVEPVRFAVGPWNCAEISPTHLLGQFNPFVRSVILRVSEARDLGGVERFALYEHLKIYEAAPPAILLCNQKHLRPYSVPNVTGVIITTNHKTDGIALPADDRRHYVAWSDAKPTDFPDKYFANLFSWLESEGYRHCAAYLATRDISTFDPKAPPKKTSAFWDIVDAGRATEEAELADVVDSLAAKWDADGNLVRPDTVTLDDIVEQARSKQMVDFCDWLRDRKNRRQIPYRLDTIGYVPVRNPAAEDGYWAVGGKRVAIYVKRTLSRRDQLKAAAEKVAAAAKGSS
jgi:hypothetical protein